MNKQLAFAGIAVKSFDEEKREFEGVATHVSADKVKDVVEPSGAQFSLPLPFLSKHRHESPVGKILWTKVEKDGIRVRGKLPHVTEPGLFKDRVDEAWHELKYLGDTMGLSIGFSPIEYDILPSGGVHFKKWRWDELSLVTVPCNGKATISAIKSAYAAEETGSASSGTSPASGAGSASSPRRDQAKTTIVKLAPAKGNIMRLSESLKGYTDTREAKVAERLSTVQKSLDEGRTADAAELETIQTLNAEIKALDDQIEMVKGLIEADLKTAKPVHGQTEAEGIASITRAPAVAINHNRAEKGLAMAQLVRLQYQSKGIAHIAAQIAESQKQSLDPRVVDMTKAAVSAASTTNPAWAGNLVTQGGVIADFVEFLRPETLLGKFGTNGIPSLRSVPFNVPIVGQTSGGEGYWVGEGKAIALTKFDTNSAILQPLKVANIAVLTNEMLMRASIAADTWIRDQLVEALKARLDTDFVNPAKAAVAGISPASVTNGVTGIASSGNDATAIRNDIAALTRAYIVGKNKPSAGVLVMGTSLALQLSMMQNPLGQSEFPGVAMNGGVFLGFPVIVSDYVPASTVIMINASDVYFADEGGFEVKMSTEASLEMLDNPVGGAVTPTGATTMVSMWQTNASAFLAERTLNWQKRRADAVQRLTGVKWGEPTVTPGG